MAKNRFALHGAWSASCVAALLAASVSDPQLAGAAVGSGVRPQIFIPPSGFEAPGDVGQKLHTNVELLVSAGGLPASVKPRQVGPPASGYLFETPASLACVYNLVTPASGCNPNVVTANPTGGSHAIAIVDAYDYPTAASDLAAFVKQFGLAAANFTVVYGTANPSLGCTNGPKPASANGSGWDVEESLDIEWAHAMAPSAKIYLVEASSASYHDLFNAVEVATKCVQANSQGEISMSFGGSEFSGETSYDPVFTGTNVVYFAAAGDYFWNGNSVSPGVIYPAASPNVVGVGGTALSRNQVTGAYQSQSVWSNENLFDYYGSGSSTAADSIPALGTGGGPSAYEARPSYQNGITTIVGDVRGTPDLGAIADPATGVWIYNTTSVGGWISVGGTSVATPVTAAIFNKLGLFYSSANAALGAIYGNTGSVRTSHVTPIVNGNCGPPGSVTSGGYGGAAGQPYDPAWIYDSTGIAWGPCNGWGSIHS